MRILIQSLRYGFRVLRKNPGFTAIAVVTLALGVGANTAIFSVLYATLFAPLPYPDPNQLVVVWSKTPGGRAPTSPPDFQDWQTQNTTFQMLGVSDAPDFNLATSGRPEVVHGARLSAGYVDKMIGESAWLGRYFLPEEVQAGRDHVVILTHRLWMHLGADRNIIGKTLRLSGEPYTVIGVRPPGYADRLPSDLLVPLVLRPEQIDRDNHFLLVLGRLKTGVTIAQAQADMDVIANRLAHDHPKTNKGWGVSIEPLHNDFLDGGVRRNVWLLMAAVGFLLLIACVNVANLLLARGSARQREVAVRTSLGATRPQIFTQFLIESLSLSVLGGLFGVGLGTVLVRVLVSILPRYALPAEADIRIDVPVLLFTLTATLLAGVLFGCIPAWQASAVNPNETLKEGGRSGTDVSRHRLRRSLVVAEFALALTLLAAAGVAIHSFWNLTRVDLGVRRDHLLTFSLPQPIERFRRPEEVVAFYRQVLDRVKSLRGTSSAEISTGLPLEGTNFGTGFTVVGKNQDPNARSGAGLRMVTPDYLQTLGIRLMRGRGFSEQDTASSPRVAMVNETFVRRYLAEVDPLQQRLLISPVTLGYGSNATPAEWQVIGVFHDFYNGRIRDEDFPEIDIPFWQDPWPQTWMAVRTAGDPLQMQKSIAAAINSIDRDLPMANVRTMDQVMDESLVTDRFVSLLYAAFAATALLLAAVGIYGVMAFMVAQRTHEIGLRMALGAGQQDVLRLVLKDGVVLAGIGVAIGLAGAGLVGRTMRGLLFGVGAIDFTTILAVSILLFAAALLASYIPARRAAHVDPMVALRYE